jgi:hypothetical protein
MKLGALCIYGALGAASLGCVLESREAPPSLGQGTHFPQMKKKTFYSEASQDKFVYTILYSLLGKKDPGYYLEIGAADPIGNNNSYFFEKKFQWKGISLDISTYSAKRWKTKRTNPLLIEDAIQSDYGRILQSFPRVIDYLSLDVDGSYDVVLQSVLLSQHIFKVITIEHDSYRFGDLYKDKERQILTSFGYHLLCPDVSTNGLVFEDWWIHPKLFPSNVLSALSSLDLTAKDNAQLIRTIATLKSSKSGYQG